MDDKWIQTFTGKAFWPLAPRAQDVDIVDIAHALGNKCRFTGHTNQFYSVAQHSVLVSLECEDAKWGLMHDAAEAYLPDVARPIKTALKDFNTIEDRLLSVIAEVFGLSLPVPDEVKRYDTILLATERRDLLKVPPLPWIATENVQVLDRRIASLSPRMSQSLFLARFDEVFVGS